MDAQGTPLASGIDVKGPPIEEIAAEVPVVGIFRHFPNHIVVTYTEHNKLYNVNNYLKNR